MFLKYVFLKISNLIKYLIYIFKHNILFLEEKGRKIILTENNFLNQKWKYIETEIVNLRLMRYF